MASYMTQYLDNNVMHSIPENLTTKKFKMKEHPGEKPKRYEKQLVELYIENFFNLKDLLDRVKEDNVLFENVEIQKEDYIDEERYDMILKYYKQESYFDYEVRLKVYDKKLSEYNVWYSKNELVIRQIEYENHMKKMQEKEVARIKAETDKAKKIAALEKTLAKLKGKNSI